MIFCRLGNIPQTEDVSRFLKGKLLQKYSIQILRSFPRELLNVPRSGTVIYGDTFHHW